MRLNELGENRILQKIKKLFGQPLNPNVIGIGDDAAVIPLLNKENLIITTDSLIEDIDFLRDHIPSKALGHKALAVNLSDLAGMGSRPRFAFLSLALPSNLTEAWIDDFLDGFHALSQQHSVELLGGDLSQSPNAICINVTLLGEALSHRFKLRSQAKPGDLIYVSGNLGDSAGGLKAIVQEKGSSEAFQHLIEQHYWPKPQVKQGHWLAQFAEVHAMMDVSDGLHADLPKILEASQCGARIDLEKLPFSPQLKHAAREMNWNSLELALCGGEDFCLLFTADPQFFASNASPYSFHCIGEITPHPKDLIYQKNGVPQSLQLKSFEHFT